MELEMTNDLSATIERLAAAAGMLQQAAERLAERESAFALDAEATLGRIVATVESQRETELEQKLAAAEAQLAVAEGKLGTAESKLAELRASAPAAVTTSGRKTLPVAMANLLAKQGVTGDSVASMEAGAIDAALVSLSLEQRIAVKAQLMRAGLLS